MEEICSEVTTYFLWCITDLSQRFILPIQISQEQLIEALEETVNDALEYLTGAGLASQAKVCDWSAWDVLCHMLYRPQATTKATCLSFQEAFLGKMRRSGTM